MLVLGIESSCDETACAVVRDGREILSNCISSQCDVHERYGGVVPELAARRHVDIFPQMLRQALKRAGVTLKEIDLISVAKGPGLIGALLVGLNFAKGLSLSTNIPFIGVNHVEAHLYASIFDKQVPLPALGVVISGGHTALLLIEKLGEYQLLGQTQDDALGEAFDKVASLLDLPYPGGPHVERLALGGNKHAHALKVGQIKLRPLDFSFSGLKTGVLYLVKGQNASHKNNLLTLTEKQDIAASFQHVACLDIVQKAALAAKQKACQSIIIGGGVSQNRYLRSLFEQQIPSVPLFWPQNNLCLDNAAMIAILGFHEYQKRGTSDSFDLEALPRIAFV